MTHPVVEANAPEASALASLGVQVHPAASPYGNS